jgi:uncharacterized protein (DUF58 family)
VPGAAVDSHAQVWPNYLHLKPTELLKPEVVAKLGSIDLKARLVVEGFLAGLHRSPYKGFSVEFTEHRQYMPGDEPKRIDWKVYAKTDRFVVREYEEETNLRAYLVLDASGSMAYKSGGRSAGRVTKLEYAGWLAASLAYLLLHQKDSCGLVTFSDKIDRYVPPRSSGSHLNVLLHQLAGIKPGGDTNIAGTLHGLAERLKRRGLVIVMSDLWDDPAAVLAALRHFRYRKHEVLVFHIQDPNERAFDFKGPVLLRDMETGRELTMDARVVRQEYQRSFDSFFSQFEQGCREARIDYHRITTDTPFDRALFNYLERRRRMK